MPVFSKVCSWALLTFLKCYLLIYLIQNLLFLVLWVLRNACICVLTTRIKNVSSNPKTPFCYPFVVKYLPKLWQSPSCLFCFWLHPWHKEVPRPRTEPVPQQWPKLLRRQDNILNPLCHRGNSHLSLFYLHSFMFFYNSI